MEKLRMERRPFATGLHYAHGLDIYGVFTLVCVISTVIMHPPITSCQHALKYFIYLFI